jgi:hypothetical protein
MAQCLPRAAKLFNTIGSFNPFPLLEFSTWGTWIGSGWAEEPFVVVGGGWLSHAKQEKTWRARREKAAGRTGSLGIARNHRLDKRREKCDTSDPFHCISSLIVEVKDSCRSSSSRHDTSPQLSRYSNHIRKRRSGDGRKPPTEP